ncbi:MAG: AcvB/VirJ family lysyl-phosphatidylglycerol hydrolase [Candidatus Aminicenantes bacterium RBG_16_66_30]
MKAGRLLAALVLVGSGLLFGADEVVDFGRFGPVTLYRGSDPASQVVLFVSGDGGWNLGVVDMAKSLAGLGALVAGIDITHYMRELARSPEACLYPAADFEALSKFVQRTAGLADYVPPVLVGYSSGATLVYALLVQAPATEFRGAVSLGFCPDLVLPKPLCKGSGLEWKAGTKPGEFVFLPASTLEVPWVALQGLEDRVCAPAATRDFVSATRHGEIVMLPKVGHGFMVQQSWMPQFKEAFGRITSAPPVEIKAEVQSLQDLPLVEVPAKGAGRDVLGVLLTGDGGWAVADRGLSNELAAAGVSVVALNSLKYFWNRKTPEESAAALGRILRHYFAAWNKTRAVLIGYSLGADVLPFLMNRLPEDLQAAVGTIVLMGPSASAEFEFHLGDWLGRSPGRNALPVIPEIQKIRPGVAILCVHGQGDEAQICGALDPARVKSVEIPGGHRLGGGYRPVASAILASLNEPNGASSR